MTTLQGKQADKALALEVYAEQSRDESLYRMAVRIRARAIRRLGEISRDMEQERTPEGHWGPSGRKAVSEAVGVSERQMKTALRVAAVPADQFEAAVESDKPLSVSRLAEVVDEGQGNGQVRKAGGSESKSLPAMRVITPKALADLGVDSRRLSEARSLKAIPDAAIQEAAKAATENGEEFSRASLLQIKAEAKERQRESKGRGKRGAKSGTPIPAAKARDVAAKQAGVSHTLIDESAKLEAERPDLPHVLPLTGRRSALLGQRGAAIFGLDTCGTVGIESVTVWPT